MVTLRNTTNIPNAVVYAAIANGLQNGVELDTIIVRNKRKGKVNGQWGWFFTRHNKYGRCVVVIVPQVIARPISIYRRKLGLKFTVNTRVEFLVKVMAHELHHAYQYQIAGTWLRSKQWKETDCHAYEYGALLKWRRMMDGISMRAASKG